MHTQVGFDLNSVKHYASPEAAQHFTERNLQKFIDAGVMFNLLIVSQRRGGPGTNAEDTRYIPLISCIRCPQGFPMPELTVAANIARLGYTVFG